MSIIFKQEDWDLYFKDGKLIISSPYEEVLVVDDLDELLKFIRLFHIINNGSDSELLEIHKILKEDEDDDEIGASCSVNFYGDESGVVCWDGEEDFEFTTFKECIKYLKEI